MDKLILKALLYRAIASIFILILSFIFTKNIKISLSIFILDFIVKATIYFLYDILWRKYVTNRST